MCKVKGNSESRGFTLIELIATIAILSLVVGIVVYFAINIIDDAKNKNYKTSISNIEKVAGSYVIENSSNVNWVSSKSGNTEYSCVKVIELIDAGYFDNDILKSEVSEDRKVLKEDYVYLERNDNKNIVKNKLLIDKTGEYSSYCNDEKGSILISVSPSGWQREKTIIIDYQLNNKLNYEDYTYHYEFTKNSGEILENNGDFDSLTKVLNIDNVNSNGNIKAWIEEKNEGIKITSNKEIKEIDLSNPMLILSVNDGTVYKKSSEVQIGIKDNGSGFSVGKYKVYYRWSTDELSCSQIKNINGETLEDNVKVNKYGDKNSNKIKYEVKDVSGKGKIYACGDGIVDVLGNRLTDDYVVSSDMWLDNEKPLIILGDYVQDTGIVSSVTIPIKVNDAYSGVDVDSFTLEDIKVTIGDNLINSGMTLVSVDENNYDLKINNNNLNGNIILEIEKNKVFDNVGNGNEKVVLEPNMSFNNKYLVKYDANEGTGAPASQEKISQVDLVLSSIKPTKSGYTFIGWNEDKDATIATYQAGGKYSNDRAVTLYAIWKDMTPPTIPTYIASYDDGSGSYSQGTWAIKQVNTVITTTDGGTGVYIQYSQDKSNWQNLSLNKTNGIMQSDTTWSGTESWTFIEGRDNTYYFRACDAAGNCSGSSIAYNIKYARTAIIPTAENYCQTGLVYNNREQILTKNAGVGYSFSDNTRTNAGSQMVKATLLTGYVWSDKTTEQKTISCSIAKASGYINLSAENENVSYGTDIKTFNILSHHGGTLSITDDNSAVNSSISDLMVNITNLDGLDVGTVIKVTVKSSSTTNYNEASSTYLLTISKAFAVCPTISDYNGVYDGENHSIVVTGGSGGVIYYTSNSDYSNLSTTKPIIKNVGESTIYVKMLGDSNHIDKECGSKTVKVTAKTLNVGDYTVTYSGESTYSRIFSTGIGTETLSLLYTPYSKNVGSYAYASSVESGKYTISKSNGTGIASNYSISGGTFKINNLNIATIGNCNIGLIYNGSVQELASGASNATYNNNSSIDAGTYSVTVNANANYAFSDGEITKTLSCSIEKATPSLYGSPNPLSIVIPTSNPEKIAVTYNGDGNFSCSSSNASIATCSVSDKVVSVTGFKAGSTTITVSTSEGTNYVAASITVPATTTLQTYTVNYDACDGSGAPSSQIKTWGETINLSTTEPTRNNYQFAGWSNVSCDATSAIYQAGASYSTNANITLYAVWRPMVTFVSNLYVPFFTTRTYTNPNNSNKIVVNYYPETSNLSLDGTPSSKFWYSLSEVPLFSGDEYKVTLTYVSGSFIANGSYSFVTEVVDEDVDQLTTRNYVDMTLPTSGSKSATFTISDLAAREGNALKFWTWMSSADAITFSDYVVKVEITKVSTMYMNRGVAYELPDQPTKNGFTFAGWYTSETGGSLVNESVNVSNTATPHTLYGRWNHKTLSISYDSNGGSGSIANSSYIFADPDNSQVNIPAISFTKTNYTADAWYVYNPELSLWLGCNDGAACYGGSNVSLGWYKEEDLTAKYRAGRSGQEFSTSNSLGYDMTFIVNWTGVDTTKPTCSLSVSGTTVTATYNDTGGSGISYYGWNSTYSGTKSTTKTISTIGKVTYYVKDAAGNTNTCSGTVTATGSTCNAYTYSTPSIGGSCNCIITSTASNSHIEPGTCNANKSCSCEFGYSVNSNSCTLICSSGFLDTSNNKCAKCSSTSYTCASGTTKMSDGLCWKAN